MWDRDRQGWVDTSVQLRAKGDTYEEIYADIFHVAGEFFGDTAYVITKVDIITVDGQERAIFDCKTRFPNIADMNIEDIAAKGY